MRLQENSGEAQSVDSSMPHGVRERRLDPTLPIPNLFIVGAVKAGTTSLHAYLTRHPQAFMSQLKEPHFFSSFELAPEHDNFMPVIREAADYQELFRGSQGHKVVGEASPSYLCDLDSAARIKAAAPDAKIIISLRNPAERAYSHYLMESRQGRETRPFEEALEADQRRHRKGWGVSFQYLEQGMYAAQVKKYLDVFGAESVKIVMFEDLTRRTADVMREVADFLEIDPLGFPEGAFATAHNPFEESRGRFTRLLMRSKWIRMWSKRLVPQAVRRSIRNRFIFTGGRKPVLNVETRRTLAAYYEADINRLETLLNRDLAMLRDGG